MRVQNQERQKPITPVLHGRRRGGHHDWPVTAPCKGNKNQTVRSHPTRRPFVSLRLLRQLLVQQTACTKLAKVETALDAKLNGLRHAHKRLQTALKVQDDLTGKLSAAEETIKQSTNELVASNQLFDSTERALSAAKADIMSLQDDNATLQRENVDLRDETLELEVEYRKLSDHFEVGGCLRHLMSLRTSTTCNAVHVVS